ncbi:MAG TPA: TRAM domain-containing protein [Actinomycetota bacterium]|nr:TRAM domain-containing protein [Actinomycetota bacterium]
MLVEAIRLIIVLASTAGAYQLGRTRGGDLPLPVADAETAAFLIAVMGAAVGYLVGGVLARSIDRGMSSVEERMAERHASEVLAATLGLLVGLAIGALIAWPVLVMVEEPIVSYPVGALLLVVTASFGMRYATRKRMELFGVMGVEPIVAAPTGGCLLDASAAIDGRVLQLWKAGLVPSPMWVPSFIIWELQGIADSSDPIRRRRGQRGLDVLTSLREAGAVVRVLDEDPAGTTEPDAKLIVLARRRGLPIVTSDSNLAKAAELQGTTVLNMHALTEMVRPPVLPGEHVSVQLIKEGKDAGQAIGYLDDGTMVVVQRAADALGSQVDVEVTSVLQTATGRMLFARRRDDLIEGGTA